MKFYKNNIKIDGVADDEELRCAFNNVKVILKRNMIKYQTKYPEEHAEKMRYTFDRFFLDAWHGGCWCGMYWMMYEAFHEMPFKRYAEELCLQYYELINSQSIWHTDIGILFLPMCVPDMRFNRSKEAKEALVLAADCFLTKCAANVQNENSKEFLTDKQVKNPNGKKSGFNDLRKNMGGKISNLNNILILMFAEKITGNRKYTSAGEKILYNVLKNNIDNSGRAFFLYNSGKKFDDTSLFNMEAHGGYTRAQAWALWGLSNLYTRLGSEKVYNYFFKCFDYLEKASCGKTVLKYCICGSDGDYDDSTSTAIVLCSILEFIKSLPEESCEYKKLMKAAKRYMSGLLQCAAKPGELTEGLLDRGFILHATHEERGVKTSATVSGDYFYVEALMRCLYNWQPYWD